ncbi:transcription factor BHLH42-like isoform X2 [Henckelia pumila]|uniref:transcription factor BHLH42-like isoform X2 n=1 Tax=Henckelia pumila TaxID=405737 RepID=UPI003C6DCC72
MAAPRRSRLRSMLRTAVQSVDWTYSLFWQRCPQQGILVWGDGYYNGAINTRKTAEPTEVATEEAATRRSQHLRELYEALVTAESRRPSSATLSPEDLTETEWFYLLSVSFSFPPGAGLPGKAFEKQRHVWLAGADEADSRICPRLILAKSSGIQTCVCIPILDGVVELGSIKWVEEDMGLIQYIKSIFGDQYSKPTISDYSASTRATSFHPTAVSHDSHVAQKNDDESQSDIGELPILPDCEAAETITDHDHQLVLEQIDMPAVGIGFGSRDDDSDNLDPDLNRHVLEEWRIGEVQRWHTLPDPITSSLHSPDIALAGSWSPHEKTQEDNVYSRTVMSTILRSPRWSDSSSAATAFSKYSGTAVPRLRGSPQCALKYILFTVPFLHKYPTSSTDSASAAQEEPSAGHVLAERRRREKLNERFAILRSLVPYVTKMDKASVLGDTIEYLQRLRKKIQELEEQTRQMEADAKHKKSEYIVEKVGDCPVLSPSNKIKKRRTVGERKNAAARVEVSIIESDALVEMQCLHKEGLLINVIQMLRKLMMEVIGVQSSMENGVFAAQLRAKVGESNDGKKASIMEVKRGINRIIYYS